MKRRNVTVMLALAGCLLLGGLAYMWVGNVEMGGTQPAALGTMIAAGQAAATAPATPDNRAAAAATRDRPARARAVAGARGGRAHP